ncbi:MAG: NUMOD3 domain-containing DNA-binding protein [Nitrosotalea sp.]
MSEANLGRKHSEETVEKISQSMREKCASEWIPVMPDNKGRKLGTSHRKGVILSEETKYKISQSSKGRTPWNKICLSELQIAEIKHLSSQGYSLRKISQVIGVHRNTIKRYIKTMYKRTYVYPK